MGIAVSNLKIRFGSRNVLRGVDLRVAPGELLTLFGPNGAGKTTLLRSMGGLLSPQKGTILIHDIPLVRAQRTRALSFLGVISHRPMLWEDLSAEENLEVFATLHGVSDPLETLQALLEKVGLWPRRRDPVKTFSRGMAQRLSIARALLHSPKALLLDEPFTGLDPGGSQLLENILAEERERGCAILLVTHQVLRGLRLADRAVVLEKGLLGFSTPADWTCEGILPEIVQRLGGAA